MFNVRGNAHNCKAILPARSAASHAEKPACKRENRGETAVYWRAARTLPEALCEQNELFQYLCH